MRKVSLLVASLAVLALSGLAVAQMNVTGDPLYGTLNLNTGFTPDPQSVAVQAGGGTDASTLGLVDPTGGACRGYVNPGTPDVRVNYVSGPTFPLRVYVQAAADTTLLVNLPDTSWRCNDDAVGFNPVVEVTAPPSGQYDIWVGTYQMGAPQPATLSVTELSTNGPTP